MNKAQHALNGDTMTPGAGLLCRNRCMCFLFQHGVSGAFQQAFLTRLILFPRTLIVLRVLPGGNHLSHALVLLLV